MEIDPLVTIWPQLPEPDQAALMRLATSAVAAPTTKLAGFVCAATIASKYELCPAVVRRHLKPWRLRNRDGVKWLEVDASQRTSRGPSFLYDIDAVAAVVAQMVSNKRPGRGSSTGSSKKVSRGRAA
jgi:hypothetical protein